MKKLFIALFCLGISAGCNREDRFIDEGEGMLRLSVEMNDEVKIVSRAESGAYTEESLKENCLVRIFKADKLIYKHAGWDETLETEGLTLSSGSYRVRIFSGDSVPAAWDKKYYVADKEFTIEQKQTEQLNVVCNVANTLVKVNVDEELAKSLSSLRVQVKIDESGRSLTYYTKEIETGKTGYFSLPGGKGSFTCTFYGTTLTGESFNQKFPIENAKTSTLYTLNYKKSDFGGVSPEPPADEGGGFVTLKVDETPLKKEESIAVYQRPQLEAADNGEVLDVNSPWILTPNSRVAPVVTVKASTPLSSVKVESDFFQKMGLPAAEYDLMQENDRIALAEKNIAVTFLSDNALKIDWATSINEYLTGESEYYMNYTVTDSGVEGESSPKTRAWNWQIVVSESNIIAIDIPYPYQIWADHTTLYGKVVDGKTLPEGTQCFFQYREVGTPDWSENIPAMPGENNLFTAELKELTPGTEYEYRMVEGDKPIPVIAKFVTEEIFTLPNNSFEYTSRDGKVLRISQDPTNFWWDSGNKGSSTLGKDVTSPDNSVKHSGNQSLKLQSQFVGLMGFGKFAAGNLFVGEFINTEKTYYGILGWGRPNKTRPLALRVWVRYTPGVVDYTETDKIKKGDKDKGIIYVAVGDWKSDDADYKAEWPIVVRTLGPKLFDPKDEGTIGYGEKIFTEDYGIDEGMKEVIIPLDYENYGGYDKIPSHIIIVASASQFGDYYSGSTNSVMWVDDMELIYEESKLNSKN